MGRERLTRSERAALTRSELLEAAERRFYRDGYHGTTLEAIAEEAGYTKGAVYSAFDSKAGVFLALVDAIIDRCLAEIAPFFDQTRQPTLEQPPGQERNQQWYLLAIEFCVHAASDPPLLEQFAVRYRRLRSELAQLATPRTPLGADAWAVVTLALANGLALERLIDPDGVPDGLFDSAQYLLYPPRSSSSPDSVSTDP